jgi:predicted dehydrogenase
MRRAAVVGCGDVSVVHLQAIAKLDDVELVGVCDTDQDRAAAAAERYGVPRFADHRQLLAAVRPDVVHVCTPHDQHTPVAVDCLEARVAVLVEKPVAHTVAEADRLIAAADRHPDVKVGICLQNRYNATTRAARDLLASGELGEVRGGSATVLWHRDPAYYQSRPWRGRKARSGGGVLINQAIHTLDLMELLVGDVVRVHGHAGRYALDDIDVYERTRLEEEGITSVQALARHDLVDLILSSRIPIPRLIDWVDQAILHQHLSPDYGIFRSVGIRTATDFLRSYSDKAALAEMEEAGVRVD